MLRILVFLPLFLIPWPTSSMADQQLVEQAIARMAKIDMDAWHYTRTRVTQEGSRIDRHDPSQPADQHWQLVSLDGRPPTQKEMKEYAKERSSHAKQRKKRADLSNSERLANMLVPDSLEVRSTDADGVTYTFRVRSPDGKKKALWEQIQGELRVVRNDGDPWVDLVRLWNSDTIHPRFGVQLSELAMEAAFVAQGQDVLPQRFDVRYDGRALFIIKLNENMKFRFHDLQRENFQGSNPAR
jgi:hypothetical protein